MEVENTLSKKIDTAGQRASYDRNCKNLLANKQIKKGYSIWVCTNPPKYRRNTITSYSMNERNIVGKVAEQRESYDLLTVLTMTRPKTY